MVLKVVIYRRRHPMYSSQFYKKCFFFLSRNKHDSDHFLETSWTVTIMELLLGIQESKRKVCIFWFWHIHFCNKVIRFMPAEMNIKIYWKETSHMRPKLEATHHSNLLSIQNWRISSFLALVRSKFLFFF